MGSSSIICLFVLTLTVITAVDGQINRYINTAWLEMDANSEYYPGGEVISQILQEYGLGNSFEPSRYRSSAVIGRNGYGRSYPRFRVINNLNNAYDSDPLTQEYIDRNYDYIDNTIKGSNRYRTNLLDIPTRTRVNSITLPRTTYRSSEFIDQDLPLLSYPTSRIAIGDHNMSQDLVSRGRETAPRLIPRSTVVPDSNEKHKI